MMQNGRSENKLIFIVLRRLQAQSVADAKILQLLHQLSFGTLADVEFLDLPARLDGLGNGTYPENQTVIHCIVPR